MDRKFFVGGNWKMNGDKESISKIIDFLNAGPLDPSTGAIFDQFIIVAKRGFI